MNYTISSFRSNMGAILDKTKYENKITSIGRRHKREFIIVPVEMLKDINYKTILSQLEKEDEDYTMESLIVAQNYINQTKEDDIDWEKYIVR